MEEFLSEGVKIAYVVFEPESRIAMSRLCSSTVSLPPMP